MLVCKKTKKPFGMHGDGTPKYVYETIAMANEKLNCKKYRPSVDAVQFQEKRKGSLLKRFLYPGYDDGS